MAGAIRILALVAKTVALKAQSERPQASLEIMSAVAGATRRRSAHSANDVWHISHSSGRVNISVTTSLQDMVSRVSGVMKCFASGDIMTLVSQPRFLRALIMSQ